jgi:sialate O-acetylesterase
MTPIPPSSLHFPSRKATLPTSLAVGALVALAAFCGLPAHADVKLADIFSDHMVLQREIPVPVWGEAAPQEEVTVSFRNGVKTTRAGADGKWRIALDPLQAGGPDELRVKGNNTVVFKDVLVGEVWVGSGQSNMAGGAGGYAKNDEELAKLLAAAPYPQIRLARAKGGWQEATADKANGFSALLFSFGVQLREKLNVPVGLIVGAVGGTPSGAWLSQAAFDADEKSQRLIQEYGKIYPEQLKAYEEKALPAWEKAVSEAKAEGKKEPNKPNPPSAPGMVWGKEPGYLYEPFIRPFVGYGIRGVLWDQGESGTGLGFVDQHTLMGALIRGWRKEWGIGDFPFLYVQKPSGGGCAWDPNNPVTRQSEPFGPLPPVVPAMNPGVEMHIRIMNYPNTAMVISSDLGSGIHPTNKSGYGSRAAQVALGTAYKQPLEYYGPVYASHTIEGNKVRIQFTHVGKGLTFRHGEKLQGFAIAGADKKFVWANASIEGNAVVVSNPAVAQPAAVQYALAADRRWANLFNQDGLPAVPFRTDAP